jgi:hypothetical protein
MISYFASTLNSLATPIPLSLHVMIPFRYIFAVPGIDNRPPTDKSFVQSLSWSCIYPSLGVDLRRRGVVNQIADGNPV